MTLLTDLNAIIPTATAKAALSSKGAADLSALVALAKTRTLELTTLLTIIRGLHPQGGADAANYAALGTVIAELA